MDSPKLKPKSYQLKAKSGFTLIELLVVVAIIGLMVSIISVGYSTQRRKARDAKRLSDMRQIKSGMDIYFQDSSGYPDNTEWAPGTTLNCQSNNILLIPRDPGYPTFDYQYAATGNSGTGCAVTVRQGYNFIFYMERQGRFYVMDEDGVVRDQETGQVVSPDTLL